MKEKYFLYLLEIGYALITVYIFFFLFDFLYVAIAIYLSRIVFRHFTLRFKIIHFILFITTIIGQIIIHTPLSIYEFIDLTIGKYWLLKILQMTDITVLSFIGVIITVYLFYMIENENIIFIGLLGTATFFTLNFILITTPLFSYYTLLFFFVFSLVFVIIYGLLIVIDRLMTLLLVRGSQMTVKI